MFADSLQGDIYNGSPGGSILLLFPHSQAHTENFTLWAQTHSLWDWHIGLDTLHKQRGLKKVNDFAGKYITANPSIVQRGVNNAAIVAIRLQYISSFYKRYSWRIWPFKIWVLCTFLDRRYAECRIQWCQPQKKNTINQMIWANGNRHVCCQWVGGKDWQVSPYSAALFVQAFSQHQLKDTNHKLLSAQDYVDINQHELQDLCFLIQDC